MIYSTQLAFQVPDAVRQRGRAYFLRGAVRITEADEWFVEAEVHGSRVYHVALARDEFTLRVVCTCPFLQDNRQPCKHVWATVLAAEAKGHLRGNGGPGPNRIQLDDDDVVEDWLDMYADEDGDDDEGAWDDGDDGDRSEGTYSFRPYQPKRPAQPRRKAPRKDNWKKQLAQLRGGGPAQQPVVRGAIWPAGWEVLYYVNAPATIAANALHVEVGHRHRKQNGDWSKPKFQRVDLRQVATMPDPADRQVLSLLVGAKEQQSYSGYSYYSSYSSYYDNYSQVRYHLSAPQQELLVPLMCRTGRCFLKVDEQGTDVRPLTWDDAGPWVFHLEVHPDASGKRYVLAGVLRRGEERLPLAEPVLLVAGGLVFWGDRVAPLDDSGAFSWISLLRTRGELTVPAGQKDELLKELLNLPSLPRLDLPEELRYEEARVPPRPRLKVKPAKDRQWGPKKLEGELSFDYDGAVVPSHQAGRGVYQPDRHRYLVRDPAAEEEAAARLHQLGFRAPTTYYGAPPSTKLELTPKNLPKVVRTLIEAGWHIEAEGKLFRQPGAFKVEVNSGIDWFELHGTVDFGDTVAHLPQLLEALRRGEDTVRLDDGTFGMLPEAWLKKYGVLAGLGKAEDDHLRFSKAQVGLLDALLASQPEASCDAVFAQARDELARFAGVEPADPPAGFTGELRGYQRDGLGWLYFLQKFGFGGCLADDMGLGKTVQVLALLESRRELRETLKKKDKDRPAPSLVVVPRSLVFNWKEEAARFTPKLRVLDHTGIGRSKETGHFDDYDVILTTYGTLRRDALLFKDVTFDYCILDEAQAIKNADSESAKAARLLRGRHRLALSGTPVENHLGELWSLFEYLNPGMLGTASVFRLGGVAARNPDPETRQLLAKALRPFILRRTKDQVAKDLPAKVEQTLYCDLEPAQRKQYNELREHYRQSLLARIETEGMNKAKMQILEALLRLRQAACHPGLIDKSRTDEPSAKLDLLTSQLADVVDEGHKVLVFSQFTSLLAILRKRLDADGVPYEYLDGRTRDRAARVERFQTDPTCKLFLISLKAGGLGLNLTAAEYVFLLDPWWNPAVEAQAIDRAHRIGQTKSVFAYRLIARDTVEEKVLELQKTKRDLADAIINADNSLVRNLGREDLELLLS